MSAPTVAQIPFKRDIVTINADATVLEAFAVLVKNSILSAPVLQPDGICIGVFSVRAMANYIVQALDKRQAESPIEVCDLSEFLATLEKVHPVPPLRDIAASTPLITVAPDASLLSVLDMLGNQGGHRVAVVDPQTKQITKIISQSAVARFLHENAMAPLQALQGQTVESSKIASPSCHCVKASEPAFNAFKLMTTHDLSGVGVLDDDGTLITSISLSDMRAIMADRFQFMGVSTLEFVQRSRSLDGPKEKPAVVVVSPSTSLLDLLGKLAASGLHRVFVVDDNKKPLGVISLKDILKFLMLSSTD